MVSVINKILLLFLFFLIFSSLLSFVLAIRPSRIINDITPEDFGLEFEEITLNTKDERKLSAWFIPNQSGSNKALILLHGYPADKGDILPAMSSLASDYNLLFFDFRGLGKSNGLISTLGAKEVLDLEASVGFLKARGFEEIGLWGFSFGGAVALMGVNLPEVKVIVSDSAYAELYLLAPELFRIPILNKPLGLFAILWGRLFAGINAFEVSPAKAILNSEKPIFIIHSKDDEVISFKHALILQKALQNNKNASFWFTEGYHGLTGEEYILRVKEFFKSYI